MRQIASSTCFLQGRTMSLADAQRSVSGRKSNGHPHTSWDPQIRELCNTLFETVMRSMHYDVSTSRIAKMLGVSYPTYNNAVSHYSGSKATVKRMIEIAQTWPTRAQPEQPPPSSP